MLKEYLFVTKRKTSLIQIPDKSALFAYGVIRDISIVEKFPVLLKCGSRIRGIRYDQPQFQPVDRLHRLPQRIVGNNQNVQRFLFHFKS